MQVELQHLRRYSGHEMYATILTRIITMDPTFAYYKAGRPCTPLEGRVVAVLIIRLKVRILTWSFFASGADLVFSTATEMPLFAVVLACASMTTLPHYQLNKLFKLH